MLTISDISDVSDVEEIKKDNKKRIRVIRDLVDYLLKMQSKEEALKNKLIILKNDLDLYHTRIKDNRDHLKTIINGLTD